MKFFKIVITVILTIGSLFNTVDAAPIAKRVALTAHFTDVSQGMIPALKRQMVMIKVFRRL